MHRLSLPRGGLAATRPGRASTSGRAPLPAQSWRTNFFGQPDDDDDTPASTSTRTVPNGSAPGAPPSNGATAPPPPSPIAGVVAGAAGSAARLVDGATAAGAAAAAKLESFRLPELDEDQFDMLKDIADPAAFGRRGEWLVFLQFTALFFVLFPPHAVSVAVQLAGLAAAAGGLVLVVGGATALGPRSLSPFPTPRFTNVLTTSGVYGVVRHPMYAGLLALAAGLTAVSVNPGRLLATACLALVLREKVRVEEGALGAVHGAAYEAYRERVKSALIPYVW